MKKRTENDKIYLINNKFYSEEDAKILIKILKQYNLVIDYEMSNANDNIYADSDIGDVAVISGDNSIEIRLYLNNALRTDNKLIVIGPNNDKMVISGTKTFCIDVNLNGLNQTKVSVKYSYSNGLLIVTDANTEEQIIARNIPEDGKSLHKIVTMVDDIINREIEHQFMIDRVKNAILK